MFINRKTHLEYLEECLQNNSAIAKIDGFRWYLKGRLNEHGLKILFIGMNPSSAEQFTWAKALGDPTTDRMLQFIELLDSPDNPYAYTGMHGPVQEVIIVNLIPLVNSRSTDAGTVWEEQYAEHHQWVLAQTIKLVEHFLPEVDVVIPMWGELRPWKKDSAKAIEQLLRQHADTTPMWAARNKTHTPRHIAPHTAGPWGGARLAKFPFAQR